MEEELGITAGWLGTWGNLPLWFYSTSWNAPESFIEFICSCIACNCEVSLCIVSWLSLGLSENSSTRSFWALFISPNHEYFVFECLGEVLPSQIILLVDELALFENRFNFSMRLVIPILERKLVAEAHRYSCWEIKLDVLASQIQILPDWANDLHYLQEEIFPILMDQRFWTQNFRTGFPVRHSLMKTLHPVSQTLVAIEINFDVKLSRQEWSAWVRFALAHLFWITSASGFPEAVGFWEDPSFSPRPCTYSEASIFS